MILAVFLTLILFETRLILYSRCQLQNQCPHEWIACGNICFSISTNKVPWRTASEECKSIRSESSLLLLDNKEKDTNIRSCLLQRSSTIADELWIDGIFDEKQKKWVFGETALPLRYQAFSRKRPEDDSEWKCIVLNKEVLYRWSSVDCYLDKASICEIPMLSNR